MAASNSFTSVKGVNPVKVTWTVRVSSSPTAAVENITGYTFDYKLKRRKSDTGASLVTVTVSILVAASGTVQGVFSGVGLSGTYYGSLWRTNVGAVDCLTDDLWSFDDTTNDT